MTFHAYNTLTRQKEPLEPIELGKVGFYVCGPTVYDLIHLGNARPLVVFDVLFRLLNREYGDGNVKYIRNITDVEDKINAAAKERGIAISDLTATTTERFHEDAAALGCLEPTVEPRATAHIPEMITLMETLIARDHAYVADGHVLFDVPSYEPYGKLSGNSRDEIVAGARVDVAPYKKDAADFVLWKPSTDDQPGWESPWGFGRPGWHLECSAMSHKHLGANFDIHGGGRDLIFPHHENEVAQTCAADPENGFARMWMHNGYLSVDGEKMSKSLGNFHTVRDLLEDWPGEALRFALLTAQYRQPLDFTFDLLKQAKASLDRFYNALAQSAEPAAGPVPDDVLAALNDDLNTPQVISIMHSLADGVFRGEKGAGAALRGAGAVMGLLQSSAKDWFQSGDDDEAGEIEDLIAQRLAARANKDFAEADRIRDDLKARSIDLMDGPEGTTWRRT
jgi:cysteinyl-tRNA synthetase